MNKLLLITTFSETIEKWNEKLDSIASQYMDNAAFGAFIVLILFIIGCWAISYLTKK